MDLNPQEQGEHGTASLVLFAALMDALQTAQVLSKDEIGRLLADAIKCLEKNLSIAPCRGAKRIINDLIVRQAKKTANPL
jgi:hypothetical protein